MQNKMILWWEACCRMDNILTSLATNKRDLAKQWLFYLVMLSIFCVSWVEQQQVVFSGDVAWLLEASKRLLAGGNYLNDFFENNPPWVLYLYLPPVILAKYTPIHVISAFHLFVFLLIISSLVICYRLLQIIFRGNDIISTRLLLVALAFTFLLMPLREFGQREHLLFVLTMPYLLLVAARLHGFVCDYRLALLIGVFAGCAFLLKPYFIPTWLLVESYLCVKQRSVAASFRTETLTICVMGLVYAVLILVRHMDYLTQVVPFALHWCGLSDNEVWAAVFTAPLIFYSIFVLLLFYIVSYYQDSYRSFATVLLLGLIGFLFAYFIQHKSWYYHRLPAISMAFVIYILLFNMLIYKKHLSDSKTLMLLPLLFCVAIEQFLENQPYFVYTVLHHRILYFFTFALGLLVVCYLLVDREGKKISIKTWFKICFYIGITYFVFYLLTRHILWNIFNLSAAMIGLVIALGIIYPGTLRQKGVCVLYTGLLGIMMSAVFFQVLFYYDFYSMRKNSFQEVAKFIEQHASGGGVYFFSTGLEVFPIVTYAKIDSASRFSYLWALGGLVKQSYLPTGALQKQQQIVDRNYFIDMISEDIKLKQPKLVFVDVKQNKNNLYFIDSKNNWLDRILASRYIDFDYLHFFSTNNNFREVWRSYRYLATIQEKKPQSNATVMADSSLFFKFDVYEHI